MMKYRVLGRTGFEVSEIGHGLWGMGGWSGSDDGESAAALDLSVELGCNFFDTAWAYGEGHSDALLGALIARHPGTRIYAASKIPPKNGKWPASGDDAFEDVFPLDHCLHHAELIRGALGTERIDLLQLHVWDDAWAESALFAEVVGELKARGLIDAFGLSLNRWQPENGIKAIATGHVDAVQVIYNIFDQSPVDELLPVCERENIGVIARVPFDEGSLTGTLTADTVFAPEDWRSGYFGPENLPPTLERVAALREDLPDGASMADVALRFILGEPRVQTSICGMRRARHVRENLATSDQPPLDEALMSTLARHRWDRRATPWSD
jgi:aryl-alcohol dehydrogenase-like predicted oxidoreductase